MFPEDLAVVRKIAKEEIAAAALALLNAARAPVKPVAKKAKPAVKKVLKVVDKKVDKKW